MSQSLEFEDRMEHYEPALNRQTEPASTIAVTKQSLKAGA
jgi:hypothetical protein